MVSATLKGYWLYRNDAVVVLDSSQNLALKKEVFSTKIHFYINRSMEISGRGLLHFYQQASSLIGNQTNHRTNMFCLINPTLAMSKTMSAFVL